MKKQINPSLEPITLGMLQTELKLLKDDLKYELEETARAYRDEVLTKMDQVLGELETIREEHTIGIHHTSNLQTTVDNHEERLIRLEHK